MTSEERDLRDRALADECHACCLCCEKYKTVKEQKKNCDALKARARIINREAYLAKKIHKLKIL